jgi:hypothetical protein
MPTFSVVIHKNMLLLSNSREFHTPVAGCYSQARLYAELRGGRRWLSSVGFAIPRVVLPGGVCFQRRNGENKVARRLCRPDCSGVVDPLDWQPLRSFEKAFDSTLRTIVSDRKGDRLCIGGTFWVGCRLAPW